MADSTKKTKNYLKGSAKEVKFSNGGSLIHIDLSLDQLNKLPVNKSGFIKLTIGTLPKPDKYGNTHSIYENDFVPNPNRTSESKLIAQAPKKTTTTDDLPF